MADKNDSLGDRMKMYEATTTGRVIFKGQPIVARLDGKSFHTFTKGLSRPYDERLKNLMVAITKELVDRYGTYRDWETDRKSTRLNSSHITRSRMPSSA